MRESLHCHFSIFYIVKIFIRIKITCLKKHLILNMRWNTLLQSTLFLFLIRANFLSWAWDAFKSSLTKKALSLCESVLIVWGKLGYLLCYVSSHAVRLLISNNSFFGISIFTKNSYELDGHSEMLSSFIYKLISINGINIATLNKPWKPNTIRSFWYLSLKVFDNDHFYINS